MNEYIRACVTQTCTLLLTITLAVLGLSGYAQQSIRVTGNKPSLKVVFQQIESQSGYSFLYDERVIPVDRSIHFAASGALATVLRELEETAQLELKIVGRNILVTAARPPRQISGVVEDAQSKQPLAGASLYIRKKAVQFRTNAAGEFSFVLPASYVADVLTISYVGYENQAIPLDELPTRIALKAREQSMEEVIITSTYEGPKLREETVGSVFSLTAKDLQTNRPIESIDKMLEGMVPGLYVEPSTSLGTPVKIHIRGQGTLSSLGGNSRTTSSQPLFVVDGVPVQEQELGDASSAFSNETLLNPIAGVNPMDIESISVLKDAAATAIYGANAANGVILITTKSGRSGKVQVNASFQSGVSTYINQIRLLSGPQYAELVKEMYMNVGRTETVATQLAGSTTIDTDWFNLTTRNAQYRNYNASISGGKEGNNYFVSFGYRDQENASPGNGLKQYTSNLRFLNTLSDKLKMTTVFTPTMMRRDGIDVFDAIYLPPNINPYNADGSYSTLLNVPNPLAVLAQNEDQSQTISTNARIELQYDISPTLYMRTALGGNFRQSKQQTYESGQNATGSTVNGRLRIFDRLTYNWTSFAQIGYKPTLLGDQRLLAIAGMELRDQYTNLHLGTGSGFSYERLRNLNLAANREAYSSKMSDATVSYYSQVNYDLKKKYYATLSARADESSIFGGDKRMAVNGALGFGWNISNEAFLSERQYIDFLRLRLSFGSTGNSRIGSYASRGLYTFNTVTYAGHVGARPTTGAAENPDLGWETNYKTNVGLDIALFGKLRFTLEAYQNYIVNLISSVDVPLETGSQSISVNTGNMWNRGMDFSLSVDWLKNKPISWESTFVGGFNRNKILSFNNPMAADYAATSTSTVGTGLRVGYSTNAIWGVKWAGIDSETGGELFYTPAGDVVTKATMQSMGVSAYQILGNTLPIMQGGMVNTFAWKGLSFSFNLQYNIGGSKLIGTRYLKDGNNLPHSNMAIDIYDRWQQSGDQTVIPKLMLGASVNNSSRFLYDFTHLKLSNLSLAYALQDEWRKQHKLPRTSFTFNVTNLFYWYKDESPAGRNGIKEFRFTFPETRIFSFGAQITI